MPQGWALAGTHATVYICVLLSVCTAICKRARGSGPGSVGCEPVQKTFSTAHAARLRLHDCALPVCLREPEHSFAPLPTTHHTSTSPPSLLPSTRTPAARCRARRWRARIEREAEHFLDVSTWGTAEVAARISADGVHVAINLNGYTKGARNEIFALLPAPVQARCATGRAWRRLWAYGR